MVSWNSLYTNKYQLKPTTDCPPSKLTSADKKLDVHLILENKSNLLYTTAIIKYNDVFTLMW